MGGLGFGVHGVGRGVGEGEDEVGEVSEVGERV